MGRFDFMRLQKTLTVLCVWCAFTACSPEQPPQAPAGAGAALTPAELAEMPPGRPIVGVNQANHSANESATDAPEAARKLKANEALEVDWLDLMSDADRERLESGDWIEETGAGDHPGEEGSFTSDMAKRQIKGFSAIPDFDNMRVKLAGYFVPLEQSDSGEITEILFVPYFGACIHVPPPPANQLVYAKLRAPQSDVNMFEAYWLEGVLLAKTTQSELAEAGYTMTDSKLSLWE